MTLLIENRELLIAFRAGDNTALSKVYHSYVNDVIQLLKNGFSDKHSSAYIRGISSPNELRDCLQDVFVKAFTPNALQSYDGIRPYRSYLMTIARNRLIDYWRAYRRDPVAGMDTLDTDDNQELDNALQQFRGADDDGEEKRLHWQQCLLESDRYFNNQDERTQNFITLRFRQGLPLLEVSRQLKMSRWKARALENKLQINLEKHLHKMGLLK